MIIDHHLREAADYASIRRLLERYADVMTRRAYAELHEIMRAECPFLLDTGLRQLTLSGPAEMEQIVPRALDLYDVVQLILLNTNAVIDSDAGRAAARH